MLLWELSGTNPVLSDIDEQGGSGLTIGAVLGKKAGREAAFYAQKTAEKSRSSL
jgi:hypothetical protein